MTPQSRSRPLSSHIFRLAGIATFAIHAAACERSAPDTPGVRVDTLTSGITRTVSDGPVEKGRWSLALVRDLRPAEGEGGELIAPADLALADDGSLLVRDSRPAVVKVFDEQGTFIRHIGREGRGPGEFVAGFLAVRGDTLAVQDPRNARAIIFDWRTGTVLAERRTSCCMYAPIGIDATGGVVAPAMITPDDTTLRHVRSFVRFSLGATRTDTIFAVERQDAPEPRPWMIREQGQLVASMAVPLQPRMVVVVDPAGGFITGWSGDYLLRTTRDGRDTVALFGRAIEPSAVSAAEKAGIVEREISRQVQSSTSLGSERELRLAFDPTLIPDRRPAYETFSVDGAGRRWVRLVNRDSASVRFDLFDTSGRWLDTVELPPGGWPESAWSPVAWSATGAAVALEGEDGRPFVRIYRIERR